MSSHFAFIFPSAVQAGGFQGLGVVGAPHEGDWAGPGRWSLSHVPALVLGIGHVSGDGLSLSQDVACRWAQLGVAHGLVDQCCRELETSAGAGTDGPRG